MEPWKLKQLENKIFSKWAVVLDFIKGIWEDSINHDEIYIKDDL